jgi:hypothetical protein
LLVGALIGFAQATWVGTISDGTVERPIQQATGQAARITCLLALWQTATLLSPIPRNPAASSAFQRRLNRG